ncbi:MmgE/PrpD family protein [Bradyrhizobium sp. PMVTL-01]|uniref:MmgE/PrpD family protein n=1 Tax=Bradyrhizobium sp. PMVTL-01 TaxID=3434999 RepID=UPI003F6F5CF1
MRRRLRTAFGQSRRLGFGAVASASVLSGFDIGRFATALNFAADMAGGCYQCFRDGTMEGHFHSGHAARAGIIAAALAGAGGEASPGALDGPDGFFSTFARGQYDARPLTEKTTELAILRARSKPFSACAVNQDTMLVIRSLQPAGFAPSDIERVKLTRPARGWNGLDTPGVMADPPCQNILQAMSRRSSLPVLHLSANPSRSCGTFESHIREPGC